MLEAPVITNYVGHQRVLSEENIVLVESYTDHFRALANAH